MCVKDRIVKYRTGPREHEILTVSEMRYRRSGSRHPRPHRTVFTTGRIRRCMTFLPVRNIWGILLQAKAIRYLTNQKRQRRTRKKSNTLSLNTNLWLMKKPFDLAQKRIATKHRPTKVNEIDIFRLLCGDCGHKMYLQQGAGTLERKHAYTCGKYRNRIRTGELCTTYYIRKSVLKELVLADLQRVLSYVQTHEQAFIQTANMRRASHEENNGANKDKELDKAQGRMSELNVLFQTVWGTTL